MSFYPMIKNFAQALAHKMNILLQKRMNFKNIMSVLTYVLMDILEFIFKDLNIVSSNVKLITTFF